MAFTDRFLGPYIERYLNQRFGGANTRAGQSITGSSPFEIVAIRAAINVLSADVAALPLKLYRKQGRGRAEASDHPLMAVLHVAPNDRMTAFEWSEAQMVSLLMWGNAYSVKQSDAYGRVAKLWPIRPDRMSVGITGGQVVYTYEPADETIAAQTFTADQILHIKGMSSDGLVGRTPLWDLREKLGELQAMESFSQSFYGNGMKRGAVLKHPSSLSDAAFARLKKQVRDDERDQSKKWQTLILEEGMDFSELTFAPEDAQLLDTRRFGVEDACRIYNLPPYKLRITTPGAVSYASVDAQTIDYLVSTLTPWLVRIEQAINRSCLTDAERSDGLFVEHNTRALLRADLKSQAEALEIGRKNNWYAVNDIREHLGENPYDDPRADDPFTPTFTQAVVKDSTPPADV